MLYPWSKYQFGYQSTVVLILFKNTKKTKDITKLSDTPPINMFLPSNICFRFGAPIVLASRFRCSNSTRTPQICTRVYRWCIQCRRSRLRGPVASPIWRPASGATDLPTCKHYQTFALSIDTGCYVSWCRLVTGELLRSCVEVCFRLYAFGVVFSLYYPCLFVVLVFTAMIQRQ